MEQHEANELYSAQAEVERLTRRLDTLTDVLRAAQRLTDAIGTENLMTRPDTTHNISNGGLFGVAYANLIDALNAHHGYPGGKQ